jgi:hypothetical protein
MGQISILGLGFVFLGEDAETLPDSAIRLGAGALPPCGRHPPGFTSGSFACSFFGSWKTVARRWPEGSFLYWGFAFTLKLPSEQDCASACCQGLSRHILLVMLWGIPDVRYSTSLDKPVLFDFSWFEHRPVHTGL